MIKKRCHTKYISPFLGLVLSLTMTACPSPNTQQTPTASPPAQDDTASSPRSTTPVSEISSSERDSVQTILYCGNSNEVGCVEKSIEGLQNIKNEHFTERDPATVDIEKAKQSTLIADNGNYIQQPYTQLAFDMEELHFDMPQAGITDFKLNGAWDLVFLPDDTMMVTVKKAGKIYHIKDKQIVEVYQSPLALYNQDDPSMAKGGFLGLAIDPDFSENKQIYVMYIYAEDTPLPNIAKGHGQRVLQRISRFVYQNDKLIEQEILLDKIPGTQSHSGGRLAIGPDQKLYATTGDASDWLGAQDPAFLGGKVLRMNTDGTIPDDNPIPDSYAYSLGHRNPQGLAWHPETKALYTSEHGTNRYDEINRIVPGANHGWGDFVGDIRNKMTWGFPEGYKSNADILSTRLPVYHTTDWTMAPSGMQFVDDPDSPWHGSLFVALLRGKHLHRFTFEGDTLGVDEIFFIKKGKNEPRLRDVEYNNGALYVLGAKNSGIYKLTPK